MFQLEFQIEFKSKIECTQIDRSLKGTRSSARNEKTN
jgi:hypothetical protein